MFNFAKSEGERTLRSCPRGAPARVQEKKLCDVPGVSCNVTWKLTDGCPEDPIIKVRFFEYDETNKQVASWDERSIRANGTSSFNLACESPGHWICYGAAN